jgi:ubiquinone/menaquinone biosynthesis C-methylase UbiE
MLIKLLKKYLTVGNGNLADREKWLESILKKIPTGLKILDAGAGQTKYKKFCDHLIYVAQDFGQYDGTGNEEGFQTKTWDNSKLDLVSDITEIPVDKSSFDAIMCIEVFEHIPEPIKAIKEFSRILKPGGKLILSVPFCSQTHFAPYFFYTGLSRYWFEKYLLDNGFANLKIVANGSWYDYIGQELKRIYKINEKYIKKSKILYIVGKLATLPTIIFLQFLKNNDNGSDEVLCYGLNIEATKSLN